MPDPKKAPEILDLATAAKTEGTRVPLDKFRLDHPVFRLRPDADFEKPSLQTVMASLALEGQQVPVEAFIDDQGRYVPTKGYRRLVSCRLLAQENHPRFRADLPIWTLLVTGATPQDLILRAVLDNETRKNLGPLERLDVVKKDDLHVPVRRAAAALGISVKTFERDRLLVGSAWMYDLVKQGVIVPSTAVILLEAAKAESRLGELQPDLLAWVKEKREQAEDKARLQQRKDGSAPARSAEQLVRKAMNRDLVVEWLRQLKAKERFAKEVAWDFGAGIDADSDQLQIEGIKVNLAKAPLERLAKVASKLARVQKGVMEYLKTRHELEAPEGPQDVVRQEADTPYDLDILREAGLDDLADELGQEIRPSERSAGEQTDNGTEGTSGTEAGSDNDSTGGA
jgi:hypothetical protein